MPTGDGINLKFDSLFWDKSLFCVNLASLGQTFKLSGLRSPPSFLKKASSYKWYSMRPNSNGVKPTSYM